MSVLDSIVKAYDIRGTVPDQLDADVAHALGVGFAAFVRSDRVVIGRDMRPVSYTHLTLPTSKPKCRSRWSPYH